ncbi:MAG: SulP family inorganic anion transporter, partial [Cyclobacteriaceae bacterium]
MSNNRPGLFSSLASDIPSGLVVFLVALPLCLGIALASGAPLFAGVISGIVGGIVVGIASGSHLSVSGPAAGLAIIVAASIEDLGSYQAFTLAVVLAGIIQLILGFLKAGIIGHYFPSAVIKGMLAGIGLTLILKQRPHALGDDQNYEGEEAFYQPDGENTFTEIILAVQNISAGALIISLVALVILILWNQEFIRTKTFSKIIPGPLVAVIISVLINMVFFRGDASLYLTDDHVVNLPMTNNLEELRGHFTLPDFSFLTNSKIYITAITIAIIASLETLLSLDAVDKLDP